MTNIFSERDPARVAVGLAALERFADRRERFLEGLDFAALDVSTCQAIGRADGRLFETLMFGNLYAHHLEQMMLLTESLRYDRKAAA